jgi:hypothetical protein
MADSELGTPLATHVKDLVKKRFSLATISDSKSLKSRCTDRKQCALFLGAGPADEALKRFVSFTCSVKPLLRWAYLDVGGTGYDLSVYKELMGKDNKLQKNALRLVMFRDKLFWTMPQTKLRPSDSEYRSFINEVLLVEPQEKMANLSKAPAIRKTKQKQHRTSATTSTNAKQNQRTESSASASETRSQKVEMSPEQAKQAQLERERRRRAQMEEEAKRYDPSFDDTEEEEGQEDDDDDDGELGDSSLVEDDDQEDAYDEIEIE